MINEIDKVLYTAKTHTTGGRDGAGKSSDGALDVKLSSPGSNRPGTNPEQLFAVGWSACFMGAIGLAAKARSIALPADVAVDAEVDLGITDGIFSLRARLDVHVPGLNRPLVEALVREAHQTCPYSRATRGNLDVTFNII
ncbi:MULTISPECIES: organic hydroperoxide resistance protein [Variovorax]|uniref:Organic hydroperoxide resistance protein n=1 Tax=Variovorax ginsengisoli TaxID=363844 RepID=A0ABT8S3U3_9BURK|nr:MULTISPECIES: organic hydroperoxide resistance protein [Variovorax]MDM0079740.1 organic hydroperoxide resistance protein [Variovorax sp. J31P179]MDN8614421.1 organic hydroperoxide resistance protein [Variovorax ginsengisoli]MDO1533591.1 organic hydroperoxide resistance protein [Variovorax ginsengisoli]